MAGLASQQLGIPDELTAVSPRVLKLQLGQQQKQVCLVTEQYLEQGKPHILLFITDVQQ